MVSYPPIHKLCSDVGGRLRERFERKSVGKVRVEVMYQQYIRGFCSQALIEPKKRSSFGKIVRQAFPFVKKRRLGPAGEQTSYYVGVVAKASPPLAPASTDPAKVEPPPVVEESALQEALAETIGAAATLSSGSSGHDWTQSFPSYSFFYASLLSGEEDWLGNQR
jgi:hypothetical protein